MWLWRHSSKLRVDDSLTPMRCTSGGYSQAPESAYWRRLWGACIRPLTTPCEALGRLCVMLWFALPSRRLLGICSLSHCHVLSESTRCGVLPDLPHLQASQVGSKC